MSNSWIEPSYFFIEIFTKSSSDRSIRHPLKMFLYPQNAMRSVSHRLGCRSFGFSEITFFMPKSFSLSLEMLDSRSVIRSLSRQVLFLLLPSALLLWRRLAKERLLFLEAEFSQLFSQYSLGALLTFLFLCPNSSLLFSVFSKLEARLQQIFFGLFSLLSDLMLNSLREGVAAFFQVSNLGWKPSFNCFLAKGEHSWYCLMVLKLIWLGSQHFLESRMGEASCSLGRMIDFFISLNFSIAAILQELIINFIFALRMSQAEINCSRIRQPINKGEMQPMQGQR